MEPEKWIEGGIGADHKRHGKVGTGEGKSVRIGKVSNSPETKYPVAMLVFDEHGRSLKIKGSLGRSRLDTQQGVDQVLVDESAMEDLVERLAGTQIDGTDGNVERVVNNGKGIKWIGPKREPQTFVVALGTG